MSSDEFLFSLSNISQAFGCSRATAAKRVKELGIGPTGKKKGYPAYLLSDFADLKSLSPDGLDDDDIDPERMHPKDRKDWYQGEKVRIELMQEKKELIPEDDVRRQYAALAKSVANELDNIPDILERDCGLSGEAVTRMQEVIDQLRQRMSEAACE